LEHEKNASSNVDIEPTPLLRDDSLEVEDARDQGCGHEEVLKATDDNSLNQDIVSIV